MVNRNLILGLVLGVVAILAILMITGTSVDELYYDLFYETGLLTPQTDLRLISQPYLEASGLKDTCLASGASWHEEPYFVGCVGLGPNSCTSDIVLSGQTQCIGSGADWYCQPNVQGHIYCKY